MKVVKQTDTYIILDDYLGERDFGLMQEYTQRSDVARNPKWIKPWDIADAMPWQGGETVYTRGLKMAPDDPRRAYPTGEAIDLLFEKLNETRFYRQNFADTFITARVYLHPPGSGLDWHDDGARFAGAYAYYTHPRWHASWGGELLIVEDDLGRSRLPDKQHMVGGKVETVRETWNVVHKEDLSQMLMEHTTSTEFVFPRPNRMVLMRGGAWHKICLVKGNAAMPRCAIAGFFLRDDDPVTFWGRREGRADRQG